MFLTFVRLRGHLSATLNVSHLDNDNSQSNNNKDC